MLSVKSLSMQNRENDQQDMLPFENEIVHLEVPEAKLKTWQEIVDLSAELIEVPAGVVTRVHNHDDDNDEIEVFISSNTVGNPFRQGLMDKMKGTLCGRVSDTGEQLLVPNALKDQEWDCNPNIGSNDLIAYLGLPLYWPSGKPFGTICVFDNKENNFSLRQQKFLRKLQQTILSDLALITNMHELEITKRALGELNDELAEKSLVLKRQSEELKVAKELAEMALDMKSKFLTNMSHELRTPLNAILGFSQLMQGSKKNPLTSKQKDFVSRIHSSGEHLLALINDILDLSTIEAGKAVFSLEKVTANYLFEHCEELVAPIASEYGISIDFQEPDASLSLFCDFTRVKQVLLNLCSNGIKYNHQNGRLDIWADQLDVKTTRITVKDTGMGIPEDQHENIFEAFNRLGTGDSMIEGTGIGMTISKKLVENMNGNLSFISKVGIGSEFYVDFPAG